MSIDLRTLMDKPLDSYERPKPLPSGTYLGIVKGHTVDKAKNENETPYVKFTVQIMSAEADVDADLLVDVDFTKKQLSKTFYLTEDAGYRLKDFIKSCGLSGSGGLAQALEEVKGAQVMVFVTTKASKSGDEFYNDIDKMAGVQ